MWDCKYRNADDDQCYKRKTKCFPGGIACVLRKFNFTFPFRKEEDPLAKRIKPKKPAARGPAHK